VEPLKKGLNNMMAGGGFTVPQDPIAKEPQTNKGLWIFTGSDMISWRLSQESQPGASLAAEVLRDQRHVLEIFKL
jgi:hypothetical protein